MHFFHDTLLVVSIFVERAGGILSARSDLFLDKSMRKILRNRRSTPQRSEVEWPNAREPLWEPGGEDYWR